MNLLLKPIPYFDAIPMGVNNHLGGFKNFPFLAYAVDRIEVSLKGSPAARLLSCPHVRC